VKWTPHRVAWRHQSRWGLARVGPEGSPGGPGQWMPRTGSKRKGKGRNGGGWGHGGSESWGHGDGTGDAKCCARGS
jgi:hypothetical protein